MGVKQKLEGRHRDGRNFPMNLLVSKIETAAGELSFMGVITAPKPEEAAVLQLTAAGMVLSASSAFEAILHRTSSAAVGKSLAALLVGLTQPQLEAACRAAAQGVPVRRMWEVQARSGDTLLLDVQLAPSEEPPLAGDPQPPAVCATISALHAEEGTLLIDDLGQIQSCSAFGAKLFGYAPAELVGQNVSMLMPRPYSAFHSAYLADHRRAQRL